MRQWRRDAEGEAVSMNYELGVARVDRMPSSQTP
jgi:hypothetical protein